MPKAANDKKKKNSTKHSQGSLRASNSVLNQREGVGLHCIGFKNRFTGRGSEDRSKPSSRFAFKIIHTKSGADNLQGHGLRRSPGAS